MTSAPHTNIHARNPKDKNNKRTEINSHELTDTNRPACAKDAYSHTHKKQKTPCGRPQDALWDDSRLSRRGSGDDLPCATRYVSLCQIRSLTRGDCVVLSWDVTLPLSHSLAQWQCHTGSLSSGKFIIPAVWPLGVRLAACHSACVILAACKFWCHLSSVSTWQSISLVVCYSVIVSH